MRKYKIKKLQKQSATNEKENTDDFNNNSSMTLDV